MRGRGTAEVKNDTGPQWKGSWLHGCCNWCSSRYRRRREGSRCGLGSRLDLVIDLAAAASVVNCRRCVDDHTHSRDKARCDPIIEWDVNEEYQQTDGADELLALARQQTIPA
jgi:hypothetical protein